MANDMGQALQVLPIPDRIIGKKISKSYYCALAKNFIGELRSCCGKVLLYIFAEI